MLNVVLVHAYITAILVAFETWKVPFPLFKISVYLGSFIAHRIRISTHSKKVMAIFGLGVA